MKKYLVIGGYDELHVDGQMGYLTPHEVCRLYGVNPEDCIMIEGNDISRYRDSYSHLEVLEPILRSDYNP